MALRESDIKKSVQDHYKQCQTSQDKYRTFAENKRNKRYYPHLYTDAQLRQFIYPLLMVLFNRLFADCLVEDEELQTSTNIEQRIEAVQTHFRRTEGRISFHQGSFVAQQSATRKGCEHFYTKTKRFYQQVHQLLAYANSDESKNDETYRIAEGLNSLMNISFKPKGSSYWRVQRLEQINKKKPVLTMVRNFIIGILAGVALTQMIFPLASLVLITALGAPTIVGSLVGVGILLALTVFAFVCEHRLKAKTQEAFSNIQSDDELETKPQGRFFSRRLANKMLAQEEAAAGEPIDDDAFQTGHQPVPLLTS